MKYFFVFVFLGALFVPVEGQGGIIRTELVCRSHVGQDGNIDIDGEIVNTGDITAYHLIITVFIGDLAKKIDDLGDNQPGGKIGFKCRYTNPDLKPGRYIAIVRVNFAEQVGIQHRAYHFLPIAYQVDRTEDVQPGVSIDVEPPRFNSKVIRGNKGKIGLILTNRTSRMVSSAASIYLPDGFHVPKDTIRLKLMPGERMKIQACLTMDRTIRQGGTYFVVVRYDQNGVHHSQHVEGKICVEERPVYFWWYVLVGSIGLVTLFVVTYYLNRVSSPLKLIL